MKITNRFVLKIMFLYVLICGMSGVMVVAKSIWSPVFGIYKEVFIFLLIVLTLAFSKRTYLNTNHVICLAFFCCFFALSFILIVFSITKLDLELPYYIYRFKIEFYYFALIFFIFIMSSQRELIKDFDVMFSKAVLTILFISVFFSFVQRYGLSELVSGLGYGDVSDVRGKTHNLVIQTQNGIMRSIGLFSSPMALAEFAGFALVFLYPVQKKIVNKLMIICCTLFLVYSSSYKTIMLIYPLLIVLVTAKQPVARVLALSGACVLLIFGYISTNTEIVYDLVKPISPIYAKYSVYLRFEETQLAYGQLVDASNWLLTDYYGYHGGFYQRLSETLTADSLYLYSITSYGFLGVFLIFIIFLFLLLKVFEPMVFSNRRLWILYAYLLIALSNNLFWNNPIVNFPSLFFPMLGLIAAKSENRFP